MAIDRTGATAAGESSQPPHGDSSYEAADYRDSDRSSPLRQEATVHRESPPVYRERYVDDRGPVNVAVGAERQDGVRWGPIWAGLLAALTGFLLLELLFYSLGWLTLDPPGAANSDDSWVVTGILALVAFFLGGLIAGATAIWKGLFSGLLHGFMVWALGVVAFIALTFFGGSALLGSFGDLTSQFGVGPQQVQATTTVSESEADEIAATAKDAAAPAFWGLFLPLGASMLGGLIGSKIWPRRDHSDPETVQLRG